MDPSRRFSRLLAALDDPDLRARRAAEAFSTLPAEEAVSLLGGLVRLADRRSDPASAALEGALRAVRMLLSVADKDRLRKAAEALSEHEVLALLSAAASARSFDVDREQYVDREMRARTLGQRKQLARKPNRDLIARLATDQDPSVLRHLLENPRTTEREVLVAASRRPARGSVLEEIFRSRRWQVNRRVRKALALNPYSPPALSSAALALLTVPDLREVAADSHLAAEVRIQARRFIASRSGRPEDALASVQVSRFVAAQLVSAQARSTALASDEAGDPASREPASGEPAREEPTETPAGPTDRGEEAT
ncbi:MAG TPA: hypothetical protein VN874_09250 [Myxococcales bacterium]|jgi:hypothetical protein|nr:hypothetical protein [Myxococcales bacterium]